MTQPGSKAIGERPDPKALSDSAHALINDVIAMDLQLLLNAVGAERALSAYREMGIYSGRAVAQNFMGRLDLKGDELKAIAVPLYAIRNNSYGGRADPIEIREHGAVVRITSCANSKAPPEFCMLTHFAAEGIAREVNPEYEIIFTHHLTQGDPYCRYVVRKRSDPFRDLEDLGDLIELMPSIDLPLEEREAITISIESSFWVNWMKVFVEQAGAEQVIAMIRGPSDAKGREFGVILSREMQMANGDARKVEKGIEVLGEALGQEHVPLSEGSREVEVEVKHCALADGPVQACMQFEFLANGICHSIGPDYELRHESMRTRGDDHCIWAVRKKGGFDVRRSQVGSDQEDPANVLALRYAMGEISEEELDKRMAYLRKHGLVK